MSNTLNDQILSVSVRATVDQSRPQQRSPGLIHLIQFRDSAVQLQPWRQGAEDTSAHHCHVSYQMTGVGANYFCIQIYLTSTIWLMLT